MLRVLTPKIWLLGFLSWFIPFAASFVFFGPGGVLWIALPLFKSLMVVIGGASGLWLLLLALDGRAATAGTGLAIGLLWLAINLALDVAFLLPMSGMGFLPYLADIGLRYLLLPMMAAALGAMAGRARNPAK